MIIVPLFDRVVVRPIEDEAPQTKGGLVIPQVALGRRAYQYGEAIAVGPGRHNTTGDVVPCVVKVGDVVAYPRQAGTAFPLLNDEGHEELLVVLREPEIIGTVTGLERASSIVGLDGDLLRMAPQSLARADSTYKNLDDVARARHELRTAPPDIRAELDSYVDDVGGEA